MFSKGFSLRPRPRYPDLSPIRLDHNKGVRCRFAPHHIKGARKLHEQIVEAIHLQDRLLLILSEESIRSEWVRNEIFHAASASARRTGESCSPFAWSPTTPSNPKTPTVPRDRRILHPRLQRLERPRRLSVGAGAVAAAQGGEQRRVGGAFVALLEANERE